MPKELCEENVCDRFVIMICRIDADDLGEWIEQVGQTQFHVLSLLRSKVLKALSNFLFTFCWRRTVLE